MSDTALIDEPVVSETPQADTSVTDFVTSIRHLPLFPTMAVQLVRSVQQEDISAAEMARQIAADVALSSHLLRLVNSSFYGLSRRIGTVADALAVLGFNMVRRIVTAAVLQRPVQIHLPDTPATQEFWRHQLLTAALARFVHGKKVEDGEEVAYMAGLLHDVGRLAMFVRWPEEYLELLQRPISEDDLALSEEQQRFGFDHTRAGAALLRLWSVPEPIVLATYRHGDSHAPEDPLAASVWQANRVAHLLATEPDEGPMPPWMLQAGLCAATRRKIVDEVNAFAGGRG
jgi:HD-like signal output (HDOD) protein